VFERIVSLAPSATELLLALGAGDRLVAVTRWCKDVCPNVPALPELDDCWTADPQQVLMHQPDLVIGCVPYSADVTGKLIAAGARFLAMNPVRLADVFFEIEMLGRLLGESEAALSLVASLRYRLEEVRRLAQTTSTRPKVWCECWPNPLIASPVWVADLVTIAGGEFVPRPGGRRVAEEEVLNAQPEMIVLAWAATGDRADPAKVLGRPGWDRVPAVRDARIHVVRDEWLNTPSLILRRGAEALLEILHPEVGMALSLESRLETALGNAQGREAIERVVGFLKDNLPHYNWVGVYLMDPNGKELVLGPYSGKPSPHLRIPLNQGICGASAREGQTVIVDDVNSDPRYLACSIETKSEIVVPIWVDGRVAGEIDIDSDRMAAFQEPDRRLVEFAAGLLGARWETQQ
jgi:L-methionine (R)-S-oxide reductase